MSQDNKCAPSKKYSQGTCFTLEALIKIGEAYNKTIAGTGTTIGGGSNFQKIEIKENKRHMLKEVTNRLENVCNDQVCWLKQTLIRNIKDEDINKNTLRPEGPTRPDNAKDNQGNFEWLTTSNILDVVKQYEYKYADFHFLGAVPIDFDDLAQYGIKNLNLNKMYDGGKTKIGIIYNLDEHYKSGSHWVASYFDLKNNNIYYFDSYGKSGLNKNGFPDERIVALMDRVTNWCRNKHKGGRGKVNVQYSQNRHQYKNSECGVYSMNFILRLLQGDTFEHLEKNKVLDHVISKCRNVYFTKRS
jgi:hypothetical protein